MGKETRTTNILKFPAPIKKNTCPEMEHKYHDFERTTWRNMEILNTGPQNGRAIFYHKTYPLAVSKCLKV